MTPLKTVCSENSVEKNIIVVLFYAVTGTLLELLITELKSRTFWDSEWNSKGEYSNKSYY